MSKAKATAKYRVNLGEDKSIFIRTIGSEANEANDFVFPATMSEWTRVTGLTESETQSWIETTKLVDADFFHKVICKRNCVDVNDQLFDIPFVIVIVDA